MKLHDRITNRRWMNKTRKYFTIIFVVLCENTLHMKLSSMTLAVPLALSLSFCLSLSLFLSPFSLPLSLSVPLSLLSSLSLSLSFSLSLFLSLCPLHCYESKIFRFILTIVFSDQIWLLFDTNKWLYDFVLNLQSRFPSTMIMFLIRLINIFTR